MLIFLLSIDCRGAPRNPSPNSTVYPGSANVFHVACKKAGNFSKTSFIAYWEEPKGITYLSCMKSFRGIQKLRNTLWVVVVVVYFILSRLLCLAFLAN